MSNTSPRRPRRLLLATGSCLLALLSAVPAVAQAPGEPATAANANTALTPPRLTKFVEAPYPGTAPAGQAAAVELELSLDATGAVTAAQVVGPAGSGFDEAALAAARQFVFEPARKGDQAIPARIRYRYVFEAPPAPPPPPTTGKLGGRILMKGGSNAVVLGAEVTVTSEDGQVTRSAATGSDGGFEFGELPPGRYRVQVAGQELSRLDVKEEVTAGDATEVTYRLAPQQRARAGQELEFGATATIEAPPREVTKRTLKAEELLRVAGTRGDALKAIEYMPGVGRGAMGMVIIRGAGPSDSDVQMEGAPVFRLYHFGDLTSFVNSRLLERIDLYPGNFSARYGRKMGGIVDVGVRDPKTDRFHGLVDVNIIDTSVLVETPLGSRASIAIAAKRSYIDAFFDKLMPEDIGVTAAPVYYDYQLIGTYRPTDKDKLRAMIYGSYDDFKLTLNKALDSDPSIRGNLSQHTGFHRGQLLWQRRWSPAVEHEITVTGGPFGFGSSVGPEVGLEVDGYDIFTRAEVRARLHERVKLMAGLDIADVFMDGRYTGPAIEPLDGNPDAFGPLADKQNLSLNTRRSFFRPAGYVELLVQATDRLTLVPGTRVDYFSDIERWTVDPRVNARLQLLEGTALKGGIGKFSQAPDFADVLPVIGNPDLRPPRAEHYGLGVEQQVGERLLLTLEGFHKRLRDLIVESSVPGKNLENGGIGRIWGAEASARLAPSKHTTGFLSYTLSRSRRNDHGDAWRLFNWDQTHILTLASSLRFGNGWDLSGTFRYVTGNPMTPVVGSTYNANVDLHRPVYGGVNSARNPAFHRLDLRLEKTWQVGGGSIAAYLDVQNAYNHQSEEGRTYNYNYSQSKAIPGLPVIPSLGLRGEI